MTSRNFVVGKSGMGKSLFMKLVIIPSWRRRRVPVLVCDPLGKTDWGDIQYQTKDAVKLTELAEKSKGCVLVVDECELALRCSMDVDRRCRYLAVASRNDDHHAYFLAQRSHMVPPSYRNQCEIGYVFKQAPEDCEALYRLFTAPAIRDAHQLTPGTFLHVAEDGKCTKYRLFEKK